jgi:hypothetical protein
MNENVVSINLFELDQHVKLLRKATVRCFWRIIRILRLLKNERVWEKLGYSTWDAYLAQEDLSFKPATIEKYIATLTKIESLGIHFDQLKEIPRSKIRLIAPHLTRENVSDWLIKARAWSWADLYEELTNELDADNGRSPRPYLMVKFENNAWQFLGIRNAENLTGLPLPLDKVLHV